MHCVDVQAIVEESVLLLSGEVDLRWSFYQDGGEGNSTWLLYGQRFGQGGLAEAQSHPLNVKIQGDSYLVDAECVDLWPDPQDPTQTQINQVDIIMWIEGRDSAGSAIKDGGGPNSEGGISSIWSNNPTHNSMYRLVHEQSKFSITDVRMTPKSPQIGDSPVLEISILNDGTKDGNITLEIQSVTDGGFPTTELTLTTDEIAQGQMSNVFIENLEPFVSSTSGMYFIVVNAETNEVLWNGSDGKKFNVAEATDDTGFLDGAGMLIVVGLGALILILLVVVVVLAKRDSGEGTYEYEYGFEEDEKSYVDLPSAENSGPPLTAVPAANADPLMAAAMAEFPQWDQATIQGYFDQGWDISGLRDWVNNQ
jgi:hypothetical protein